MKIDFFDYLQQKEMVIKLWQESFGDSREDVEFFLSNCTYMTSMGGFIDGKLITMLFLVDCKIMGIEYKYIYAACTSKDNSNRGYMTEVINYCKQNFNHIALIPANNDLIKFYQVRGFNQIADIQLLEFSQTDSVKEYLLEGYQLDNPCVMLYNGG